MLKKILLLVIGVCLIGGAAFAAVPEKINFQGRVTPRPEDTKVIYFTIGTWAEHWTVSSNPATTVPGEVYVDPNGVFSVNLGEQVPITPTILDGTDVQVDITVDTTDLGSQPLTSVPYALVAESLVGGGGVWEASGSDIYYDAGKVGIGTETPSHALDVDGVGRFQEGVIATAGGPIAIAGVAGNPAGIGVSGAGLGIGVWGSNLDGEGFGVYGGSQNSIGVGGRGGKAGAKGVTWDDQYIFGVLGGTSPRRHTGPIMMTIGGGSIKAGAYGQVDEGKAYGYLGYQYDSSSGSNKYGLFAVGPKHYLRGKVGIGTTAPAQDLHIHGGTQAPYLLCTTDKSAKDGAGNIIGGFRIGLSYDHEHAYITQLENKDIRLQTNKATRMTITNDGKVGIGTDDPEQELHIVSGAARIIAESTAHEYSASIDFHPAYITGTFKSPCKWRVGASGAFDRDFYISYLGSSGWNRHLTIVGVGTGTTDVEDGNVGIGTPSPTEKLDVDGYVRIRPFATGAGAASVYADVDGTLYLLVSDKRKKTNISPLVNSLDKVTRLTGYSFNWKESPQNKKDLGLIAQDVEPLFPETVFTNKDGYMGINYNQFTAVFVEAIKELKAENEALKKRIEVLENK